MRKAWVVGDGQWGSTGKGLIAGYLANEWQPDLAVCNFGPNAGHTWVSEEGESVIVKQLPMALISPSVQVLLIGPGSIVDPVLFKKEIEKFSHYLKDKRIYIHERAALCLQEHKDIERAALATISSTFQGTGAALAAKTLRKRNGIVADCDDLKEFMVGTSEYLDILETADGVQIESAQGLELGVNSGFSYPYCTCRDITPQQVLADVLWPYRGGIPQVILSMRTYPIRVGDQWIDGEKVGTSGPVYPDQEELTWDQLGVPSETTTVTGKIRRVFSWSWMNAKKAGRIWRPDYVFLNFVNYLDKEAKNQHDMKPGVWEFISKVEQAMKSRVRWLGFGPRSSNISSIGT